MSEIVHDKENREFTLNLHGGHKAYVSYSMEGEIMKLVYSKVPDELSGQGIGKLLVEKTFEKLTKEGYKAIAICSYIRLIAMRSNKWKEIIHY
ncbi:MAG: GNAT family N-acetyltransferase [Crocinitomicaceae bacterium]